MENIVSDFQSLPPLETVLDFQKFNSDLAFFTENPIPF